MIYLIHDSLDICHLKQSTNLILALWMETPDRSRTAGDVNKMHEAQYVYWFPARLCVPSSFH